MYTNSIAQRKKERRGLCAPREGERKDGINVRDIHLSLSKVC